MRFLLLLLLSTVTFGQTIEERVSKFEKPKEYGVKYDKFAKTTTVDKVLAFRNTREAYSPDTQIVLRLGDNGDSLIYLWFVKNRSYYDRPTLKFLLDGELLAITNDDIDSSVIFLLTQEQAERIAKSKTVEMQLQGFETVWDATTLTAFRNIVSLTKPPPR